MHPLVLCSSCDRHIQNHEAQCPFCGTLLSEIDRSRVAPDTKQRLSRAAMFLFGATVACSSGGGESTTSGAGGAGGVMASSVTSSSTTTGTGAMYGSPPTATNASGAGGAGGLAPMYGLPPGGAGGK
jgi:hypothetical protein